MAFASNTELVRCFVSAVWNSGDLSMLNEMIGENYTIHHDPGDPWEGQTLTRAGFADRVRRSRAPVPDQTFEICHAFEGDGNVAIFWLWKGTHKGKITDFAPTGKTLTMSGSTLYFLANRQITGHWQIADRLGIYQQLAGDR